MAVLPFLDLGADGETEYLADGLTEETLTHLGRLRPESLGVIARTSVMRFKGGTEPVSEIARALGVDYLLEGSVAASGDDVRVNVKLIEAEGETQLWAETYEGSLGEIHEVQAQIGQRVASALADRLLVEEAPVVAEPRPVDPRAYEAYLRGWHHWNRITAEGIARSIDYFSQAVEIEPDYAAAWSGLAAAHHVQGSGDFVDDREAYPRSKEAAIRALAIDPGSAEAQAALAGVYANHEWDWGAAERAFGRALELGPNSAFVHHRFALFLSSMGRHEEALERMRLAAELDPVSPLTRWNLGLRLWLAGETEGAIAELQRLPELSPGFGAEVVEGLIAVLRQDWEVAVERLEEAAATNPQGSRELLGYAYGRAGRGEDARRILEAMEALAAGGDYVPIIDRVAVHAATGDLDTAFALLDEAYRNRDDALVDLKSSLLLEPLRGDARYTELLHRMGLPVG